MKKETFDVLMKVGYFGTGTLLGCVAGIIYGGAKQAEAEAEAESEED